MEYLKVVNACYFRGVWGCKTWAQTQSGLCHYNMDHFTDFVYV